MTFPEALVAEIRAEAAAQRIPLSELAKNAGMARSALYNWIDRKCGLPISSVYAIAGVLRIRGSELLARAEQRERGTVTPVHR